MKKITVFLTIVVMAVCCACTRTTQIEQPIQTQLQGEENSSKDFVGLEFDYSMELKFAKNFSVDYFKGGYALIDVNEEGKFLVIPENMAIPEGLPDEVTALCQPVENIYLSATAAMDFFAKMDGLDSIKFSGTDIDGWYIDEAKKAMEDGVIKYAGKYSAPDYEMIVSGNCGLAIESTMIYHSPEVKEKLEEFNIPVFVDRSSYEEHPLGRTEWMKIYSVILGREEEAKQVFDAQAQYLNDVTSSVASNTVKDNKSVVFFYITSNNTAYVRKSDDYVSKIIELAGGSYCFEYLDVEESASSSVNMTLEEFYSKAVDADYIIYNSAIDGGFDNMQQLLDKFPLLEDFEAVKADNVWCTTKSLYQETTSLGKFVEDVHTMLYSSETTDKLTFLYKLN